MLKHLKSNDFKFLLPQNSLEQFNAAAQSSDHQLRAVSSPSERRDGVEVGQVTHVGLFPDTSSWRPIEDAHLIPGAHGNTLTTWAAVGHGDLSLLGIPTEVEGFDRFAIWVVHGQPFVTTCCQNVRLWPRQGISGHSVDTHASRWLCIAVFSDVIPDNAAVSVA